MARVVLIYQIPKGSDSTRIQFTRRLFGAQTRSHNAKYTSTTTGILDAYERPIRGVVFFDEKHLFSVKRLCQVYDISAKFYKVDTNSTKKLMVYESPKGDSKRIQFSRKIFSTTISTKQGKYSTQTQGILTTYEKPTRGCIIYDNAKQSDVKKVTQELEIRATFVGVREL